MVDDAMTFRTEHLAEGVTLILGDCREVLPTLGRFDACVTDPPYGIDYGRAGGFSASHGWGPWRENVVWDQDRPERSVFDLIRTQSDAQIIWGGNYFTDYLPPTMQWLVWDKGQREFSLADFEMAWSSQRAAARIISYPRALARLDGKEHPTQKPLEVMQWCLDRIPDAKTILDPYCGSGTTGVAAVTRGRHFTGVEIHEPYFDIACRRISDALKQPDFFIQKPAPMKQEAML
jgi:DNA modification methylase